MINRRYKLRYWYSLYFQPNHTEQSSVELSQFQSAGWPFNEDFQSWLELYDQYVIDFDIDFKVTKSLYLKQLHIAKLIYILNNLLSKGV